MGLSTKSDIAERLMAMATSMSTVRNSLPMRPPKRDIAAMNIRKAREKASLGFLET